MLKGCVQHTLQNEERCVRPVGSVRGGNNDFKCIPTELAWKGHEQLSSHGGPEQGNGNVFENQGKLWHN